MPASNGDGPPIATTAGPLLSSSPSSSPSPAGSASSSDLGLRLRIDTSKVKGTFNEDSPIAVNGNGEGGSSAADSLSLLQLKRMVGDLPRLKQPEYAFKYTATDSLPTELSEWFSYSLSNDLSFHLAAKDSFEKSYTVLSLPPNLTPAAGAPPKTSLWTRSKEFKRRRFISRCTDLLEHTDQKQRVKGLEGLSYIVQGVFGETHSEDDQLAWIHKNVALVRKVASLEGIYNCLRGAVGREWDYAAAAASGSTSKDEAKEEERLWNRKEIRHSLTVLYFLIEVSRRLDEDSGHPGLDPEAEGFRDEITDLPGDGGLLGFLVKTVGKLRWSDGVDLPLMSLLLLTWKTFLVVFGSPTLHLPRVKAFARVLAGLGPEVDKSIISASPLDYHLFRQDLIAKYPVYDPPKPLFPFDTNYNSFLPNLSTASSARTGGNGDFRLGGKGGGDNLGSILDRPVHIATPMPSPPPSPGGAGGKGGKKQNYQTNQSFPFLYPTSSSSVDFIEKKFAGNCWWKEEDSTGSGVPKSIEEAGELYHSRVRSTLAQKQLWDEREGFLKHERGWEEYVDDDFKRRSQYHEGREKRWEEKRLEAVEEFYKTALPQIQSFVIVLLKVILANLTAPPPQPPPPPPPPPSSQQASFAEKEVCKDPIKAKNFIVEPATGDADFSSSLRKSWAIFGRKKPDDINLNPIEENGGEVANAHWAAEREKERIEREREEKRRNEEIDAARMREITSKTVSAILLVMLKWFRCSHILKFEYLSQLLFDSNYMPLVLRLFNSQDVVALVTGKTERKELSYFHVCNQHSASPQPLNEDVESSPDEACPPPIQKFHRDPTEPLLPPGSSSYLPSPSLAPPDTITDFSWRCFFTTINFIRILQKLVKSKAHRNLALVQYKSSAILRKPLKCPQTELRLYILKVFKGQVPYCGRKWRQSNMRVITNIYLYVRPELGDGWLAGGDVDAEVEEALPQEQALRALTQFYNVRRYPKAMGVDQGLLEEESDFFRRELEKMGNSFVGGGGADDGMLDAADSHQLHFHLHHHQQQQGGGGWSEVNPAPPGGTSGSGALEGWG